jgi:hypothetical protein
MRTLTLPLTVGSVIGVLLIGGLNGLPAGALPGPPPLGSGPCTGAWELVDSPNPSESFNVFTDVAALAPDDVWAVGHYLDPDTKPLLARWTGASWELHDPGLDLKADVKAVAFASPTDGWGIGASYVGFNSSALALHWDGAAWLQVEIPTVPGAVLQSVDVVAPDDVWAVGFSSEGTLIEHWDGVAWTIVPSPSPTDFDVLSSVAAVSPTNVWAVGYSWPPPEHQLIEHWDGTEWSIADAPGPPDLHAALYGVAAVPPSEAWAVGFGPEYNKSLIERWDGSRWRPITAPQPGSASVLHDVAVVSARQAWAVGSYADEAGDSDPLVDRWDGIRWRVAPSAPVPFANPDLNAVSASSRNDAWAVGGYYDGRGFTIVERRCIPGGL